MNCIGFQTDGVAAGQTFVGAATPQRVDFTSTSYDLGNLFDLVNDRWLPPPGLISLNGRVDVPSIAIGQLLRCEIRKNGVLWKRGSQYYNAVAATTGAIVAVHDRAIAGDFYELWWQHTDPLARTVTNVAIYTYFAGACIGVPCMDLEAEQV
jgi:hypothetical protein